MTLTAHGIVGAGVAVALQSHPVLAIAAAFASHFLVDAIPHYDYPIRSASINPKIGAPMRFDRALLLDFFSIGTDFALGMVLGTFLFGSSDLWSLAAIGAFMGIFPDPLQFVYGHFRHEPLVSLQKFHQWIHTSHHLREHVVLGVVSQLAFLFAFVWIVQTLL